MFCASDVLANLEALVIEQLMRFSHFILLWVRHGSSETGWAGESSSLNVRSYRGLPKLAFAEE
jgi:hypothetical protein